MKCSFTKTWELDGLFGLIQATLETARTSNSLVYIGAYTTYSLCSYNFLYVGTSNVCTSNWADAWASVGYNQNTHIYRMLVNKSVGKQQPLRSLRKDNTKANLSEITQDDGMLKELVQDCIQWQILVLAVLEISDSIVVLWSTKPQTEMSTRNLSEGKRGPARKFDKLTAICEPIF
jgi:hypothetical protein